MKINKLLLIKCVIPVILIIAIYHTTLVWLYEQYRAVDSYYSHGFLIPFISGFLIWQKRHVIAKYNAEPSIAGLLLFIMGLLMQSAAVIGGVFFVSEISVLLVLFGLILYMFGMKIFREILFPLSFLIFMLPVPLFIINLISFPMRMMVTKSAVFILKSAGMAVNHRGFEILFPNTSLVVGNPCSGLRSLIAFLALGSLFAYFLDSSKQRKVALVLITIPIAFVSNMARVILLSLVTFVYGAKVALESFFHTFSGIMVFLIGMILLLYVRKLMLCRKLKSDT